MSLSGLFDTSFHLTIVINQIIISSQIFIPLIIPYVHLWHIQIFMQLFISLVNTLNKPFWIPLSLFLYLECHFTSITYSLIYSIFMLVLSIISIHISCEVLIFNFTPHEMSEKYTFKTHQEIEKHDKCVQNHSILRNLFITLEVHKSSLIFSG